ncbi:MAG TPA: DMT family transporter [Ktedonobacteraceae bacterium]|nr:DMT family transporter [Ktedonobacteraceae bacterium]
MFSEKTTITETGDTVGTAARETLLAHKWRYDALLVFVTMIWGSTFLVVKNTVRLSGPFTYLAFAYGVGALTLALIFRKRLARITRAELRNGLIIGLILFTGYALQTTGLQSTTVSKAGFITGLNVPLIPIFMFLLLRQKSPRGAVVGIVLSFAGLFFLSFNNQLTLSVGIGELLIFGAAVAFALHVVAISRFAPGADATNLVIMQIGLTSLLSFISIPLAHQPLFVPSWSFWIAVVLLGTIDVAFTLLVMNRVQQFMGGTKAALIYALEPVWAALTGLLLAGDVLSVPAWIGCACILAGMVVGRLGQAG